MKTSIRNTRTLVVCALASVLLVACSATPTQPDGANIVRTKLMRLQSDALLATRAPVAIREAELALRAAEKPQVDKGKGEHLVYMADRKVEIAIAVAQSRLLVDQRETLSQQRAGARLDSRTREVDTARSETEAARMDTAVAQQQAKELKRQIAQLNAKATERGLVVTLGDMLFDTGKADLKRGSARNLAKLAIFLSQHKERSVLIEGHTDSTGKENYNLALSQRRADSVRSWLMSQGVEASRIVAIGKGEGSPIANNNKAAGRQLNRRVEVIIENSGMTRR